MWSFNNDGHLRNREKQKIPDCVNGWIKLLDIAEVQINFLVVWIAFRID